MIRYGIIGAGWRSEFYLRIATLVPETFTVSGIYIRNPQKRAEFSKKYNVNIFDNLEDLLATDELYDNDDEMLADFEEEFDEDELIIRDDLLDDEE